MTLAARRKRDASAFKRRTALPPEPDESALQVIDATQIDEPANAEEALALHALYAEAGDRLTVHEPMCRLNLDVCEDCTCSPRTLHVGATA